MNDDLHDRLDDIATGHSSRDDELKLMHELIDSPESREDALATTLAQMISHRSLARPGPALSPMLQAIAASALFAIGIAVGWVIRAPQVPSDAPTVAWAPSFVTVPSGPMRSDGADDGYQVVHHRGESVTVLIPTGVCTTVTGLTLTSSTEAFFEWSGERDIDGRAISLHLSGQDLHGEYVVEIDYGERCDTSRHEFAVIKPVTTPSAG